MPSSGTKKSCTIDAVYITWPTKHHSRVCGPLYSRHAGARQFFHAELYPELRASISLQISEWGRRSSGSRSTWAERRREISLLNINLAQSGVIAAVYKVLLPPSLEGMRGVRWLLYEERLFSPWSNHLSVEDLILYLCIIHARKSVWCW